MIRRSYGQARQEPSGQLHGRPCCAASSLDPELVAAIRAKLDATPEVSPERIERGKQMLVGGMPDADEVASRLILCDLLGVFRPER